LMRRNVPALISTMLEAGTTGPEAPLDAAGSAPFLLQPGWKESAAIRIKTPKIKGHGRERLSGEFHQASLSLSITDIEHHLPASFVLRKLPPPTRNIRSSLTVRRNAPCRVAQRAA